MEEQEFKRQKTTWSKMTREDLRESNLQLWPSCKQPPLHSNQFSKHQKFRSQTTIIWNLL